MTPNDCRRQPLVFKQVKTFLASPYLTAPQTPGLDPPLGTWWGDCGDCCSNVLALWLFELADLLLLMPGAIVRMSGLNFVG